MNTDNIKNIQIRDYLKSRGFNPAKEYSGYGMYRSPFRDESTPSLKVDYAKNLWYDFGSDEGGSIIDLVMKMDGYTFNDAIEHLREQPFIPVEEQLSLSFHRNPERNSGITLMEDKPLEHPRLLEYLQIRKINADIALEQCREIHYSAAGNIYYAIGFANDAGGYELRNPAFKGHACPAKKDDIAALGHPLFQNVNAVHMLTILSYSNSTLHTMVIPFSPSVNRAKALTYGMLSPKIESTAAICYFLTGR